MNKKQRFRIIWYGGPDLPQSFWQQFTGNVVWSGAKHFIVEYKI